MNGIKRCIEKYLLLKPKWSNLTERPSMFAFNLQCQTVVCFQEFVKPFCQEAENAYFQPNPSISEIAVNLRQKLKTNVYFRLLCCVFAYLRELNGLEIQRVRSAFLLGAAFGYSRVNGNKGCIEKYLLLKPRRSNLAERPSMCAFNV